MDNKVIKAAREQMEIALKSFQSKIRGLSKNYLRKMLIDYLDNKVPLGNISNIMETNPQVFEIYPFDKGALCEIRTVLEKAELVYDLKDGIITVKCVKFPGQAETSNVYTEDFLSELQLIYANAVDELQYSSISDERLNSVKRLKWLVQSYRRKIGMQNNDDDMDDDSSLVPAPG